MTPTLHLIRHAQGFHNLSAANHSIPDALLTEYGKQQCQSLHDSFPAAPSIDLIVASPLKRTIYTALLSFKSIIEKKNLVVLAVPDLQEVSDMPSDTGSELAELETEFAGQPVDFSLLYPGWNRKEGRGAPWAGPMKVRAQKAREWLRDREETNIAVVTHGGFLAYFTGDFSHVDSFDWEAFEAKMTAPRHPPMTIEERIAIWMSEYPGSDWANAEYRSYVYDPMGGEKALVEETPESLRRRCKE
ncbi:phosphoglycerate mutase-like protein [Thozetella sp. PMI_491]|nr:phosphoglycerate mutase-like protein [Thozetella sp. PMI_491]